MALAIEDYALIGDCMGAGLVGKDGSIDWLCLPRFDSAACFAALLGTVENGRWRIAPRDGAAKVTRRYLDDTLVLETLFETASGQVALLDFMPINTPVPEVVRIVEGRAGKVTMDLDLVIRFDFGAITPWVRHSDDGVVAVAGPDLLHLHTPVETHGEDFHTVAQFTVEAGQRVPFTLVHQPSHLALHRAGHAEEALQRTVDWWHRWASRCCQDGAYRKIVMRSLITLKALTYAPTGGIVAAPTLGLPELPGGVRNWDYRYCWLRDATFTLYALMNAGFTDEALQFREWLQRAVAGKPSELQIMYGVAGERRLTEMELKWLAGYEGSRPVRVGNAAYSQLQLDVFGELMDTMHVARRWHLHPHDSGWRVQRALLEYLEKVWMSPDEGIWEVRGPRRHFTHSKMMAWVAFDRGVKAVEQFGLPGPLGRWKEARDRVHRDVCEHGFNRDRNAFVQYYGSHELDASLLTMTEVGFLPPSDSRVIGTVKAIEQHLVRHGFVMRYDTRTGVDALPGHEGAFLACSFWLADNLLLQRRRDEAEALFNRLVGLCNDVGLLAEEYDPISRRQLGNFPQAFSHVALVNTAINLTRGKEGPVHQRQH